MSHPLYPIVKGRIDEFDYLGLLSGGCPADEFDSESRMVAARIHAGSSLEEIARVLAEVFSFQFGEAMTAEDFLCVAQRIRQDLL